MKCVRGRTKQPVGQSHSRAECVQVGLIIDFPHKWLSGGPHSWARQLYESNRIRGQQLLEREATRLISSPAILINVGGAERVNEGKGVKFYQHRLLPTKSG